MRRLATVVLFAAVLVGGSATALVASGGGASPVDRLLTDTLGSKPAQPAPGPPGETAASPSQPEAQPSSQAPAPTDPATAPDPAPAASPPAAASPPDSGGLRPLAETGTNPFAGLAAGAYGGYASGTVVHADALQSSNTRLADVEVAFSGATYTSGALPNAVKNEVSRVVTPALAPFSGYGRGSGLEVGLAVTPSGENQVVLGDKAEAKAPPSTALVTKQVGPISLDPLAVATLLRGQAQGRAVSNGCVIGSDLGYGLGYAADLGLLDAAPNTGTPALDSPVVSTTAPSPERAVSQSVSRTTLVPGVGGLFGLMSEARQTIAPVTFFRGTPNQFTLEVAGEWVLRVTADGTTGSFFYGPGATSPETPVVRTIDAAGKVTNVVTLQQLLTDKGLTVTIPGVAEIAIGEAPRALGGAGGSQPTATGTAASAAVDVARVRLLDQAETHAADVRVGHMEAAVAVPAGGITCGIGMAKVADPSSVRVGQDFTWIVTVSNPHDCTLTSVKVVDTITTAPAVPTAPIVYSVLGQTPPASATDPVLVWNDIGPIGPGQSKELRIVVRVSESSGAGRFTDLAEATGVCGPASAQGSAGAAAGAAPVTLAGRVVLEAPDVTAVLGAVVSSAAAPSATGLPRTGGGGNLLPPLGLLGLAALLGGVVRVRK